jgi:hypothetical protein
VLPYIYLAGFALLEISALHGSYRTGALDGVGLGDLLSGLALSIAINALWPIILVLFLIYGPPD